MKIHTIFFVTLLLSSVVYADDEILNSDGEKFQAPRLAGDSLPISGVKIDTNLNNVNSIQDAFSQGKVKGLIRYGAQHRDSNILTVEDSPNGPTGSNGSDVKQYSAIGGYLGYETAPWFNTSIGATFYTANNFGNSPDARRGLGGLNEDGGTQNSYAVLGEAFIKFKNEEHRLVFGRQEMPNYRFISLSNIRFGPFTHEGTSYENTMFDGLQVNLAYITKQKDRNAEGFDDMVRSARVNNGKTRGSVDTNDFDSSGNYNGDNKAMGMLGLIYKQDNYTLEFWDYHVTDFINTIYLYADYTLPLNHNLGLTFAGQYAQQNATGGEVAGDVNTWVYGLKAQIAHSSGITLFTAWNETKYNEGSYDGGTIFVRWGTPQMFNSYQVQDSELAGTKSLGVGLQLELGKMGLVNNTVVRFRYADYNLPDNLNQTDARLDRSEATFDLRYSFEKNDGFGIFTELDGLSVQFRISYNDYDSISAAEVVAYRNLHGYDIPNVTKDFVDTRIYVDYNF